MAALCLLFFAGCATTRADALAPRLAPNGVLHLAGSDLSSVPRDDSASRESTAVTAGRELSAIPEPAVAFADYEHAFGAPMPQDAKGLRENRFTIKGGYYGATEDAVDDGYIFNAAATRFLNNWLAVEFEVGYLEAEGDPGLTNTEVWAIPLMVNGRVNVPAWILDIYGGLGIGTFYYDAEATTGSLSADVDGWLLAGNVFLGASINLADTLALGLEGKYYVTDEISGSSEGLDAFAAMLTLGWSF